MTVDESVENLKIAVEAFERLRVGLYPFVKDTVTDKFPNLKLQELDIMSDWWVRWKKTAGPDADPYAGMDVTTILSLMISRGEVKGAFQRTLGTADGEPFGKIRKFFKKRRNQVAHHNESEALTRQDVRDILKRSRSWLTVIVGQDPPGRDSAANQQLVLLEALQNYLDKRYPDDEEQQEISHDWAQMVTSPPTSDGAAPHLGSGGHRARNRPNRKDNRHHQPKVVKNGFDFPAEFRAQVAATEGNATAPPAKPTTTR